MSNIVPAGGNVLVGAATGLVSVSTTRKTFEDVVLIERDIARSTRLQKNVGIASKLHMMDLQGQWLNIVMVTLTYATGNDWRVTHVTTFMDKVRNWHRSKAGTPLKYVWVAETTERGKIHYHVIFFLAKKVYMSSSLRFKPHGGNDGIALHLGASRANRRAARVSEMPLYFILHAVAIGPENLHTLIRHFGIGFGSK